jgi:hypothetical protein
VDTAEGQTQECGAASGGIRSLREPTGFCGACSLLLPSPQIIFRADEFHSHPLLACKPSIHGQNGSRGKDHRLTTARGSGFLATKMAHRSLSTNHLFYWDNQSAALRSRELISSIALERAAPVGFAGRVARREFSANSPPGGTATDSAAFQWAGNLRL